MSVYVDGFVIPVPKVKLADYRRLARKFGKLWIACGALGVHECAADDVRSGKLTAQVDPKALPFDGQRMFWGGFKEIVGL